jgi:hypothetical protein
MGHKPDFLTRKVKIPVRKKADSFGNAIGNAFI